MIDLAPPPKFIFPRPAIIKRVTADDLARFAGDASMASFLPGMFPGGQSEAAPSVASVVFRDTTGSASNLTDYTFAGTAIGTAASDRYIVVVYAAQRFGGSFPIDPVITVDGAACTSLATVATAAERIGIHITNVPVASGTTADVVVDTSPNSLHSIEISVFSVTGLLSNTATDTLTSTAAPPTGTIDCEAGGVIIAVGYSAADGTTLSWTGLTERSDSSVSDTLSMSSAADDFAAAQTGLTITATPASSTRPALAAVALR